ncbi:hypothetical protein V5739_02060 [Salinimicrobium sp. TIG7-5_MAKvit]|uniref:hypothetical protein n=1 Tax=Salinimicrobium sp. TIG7-5_MAKvit TaxID=3121289 RepID=UPI003C6E02D5
MIKNMTFSKIIGLTILCFSASFSASSQNTAVNFGELLNSPVTSSGQFTKNDIEELSGLIYDLNPTIFIGSSGYKILGEEAPMKAELSAGNFNRLSTANPGFNNVKLLKMKIESEADFNASFDLSRLQGFENLEYVFVECTFECSTTRIENMFSNIGNLKVLYIISTPE